MDIRGKNKPNEIEGAASAAVGCSAVVVDGRCGHVGRTRGRDEVNSALVLDILPEEGNEVLAVNWSEDITISSSFTARQKRMVRRRMNRLLRSDEGHFGLLALAGLW